MDIETVIRSEADQKEKQTSCSLAYMWNLETWYRWTYLQSRNRDTDAENKCVDNEGGVRKGVLLLSCWALFELVDCSTPGSSALHYLLEFAKIYSVESVMLSNHPILCCPLLLLPSILPSIRVFSNESALRIRWPACWDFSFSNRPFSD